MGEEYQVISLEKYNDCKIDFNFCERQNYDGKYLKQHKYYLHINDDLANSTEKAKIALECELSTSDQHIQGHSEFIGSDSVENLKQYSDCKFACIKCEKQLTVEKEVGEHMDTEGRPVHDGREIDNLNFSSQGEEDLKKSKLDSNFACKLCEKRSYDERNLKKHLQVKHKEKISCRGYKTHVFC